MHPRNRQHAGVRCNAQALVMHMKCRAFVTIVGHTHSSLGFSKYTRRCHTDVGFKRSLVAFAEREQAEQPWSADHANQRWGHTPYQHYGEVDATCGAFSPPVTAWPLLCRQAAHRKDVNLVLVNPQIPQNAGSVARTCAATSVALHLVKPLGFDIDSRKFVEGCQVSCSQHYHFILCDMTLLWQVEEGRLRLLAICCCQSA